MDRPIEKRKWTSRKMILVAAIAVTALIVVSIGLASVARDSVEVNTQRLSFSQVRKGDFSEYVPVNGVVQPHRVVFLDVEEGGIVRAVHVNSGDMLRKGDPILELANGPAQMANIETENRLLENLNQLRNSRISLTQSRLMLQDQLLDVEHQITERSATFQRYQQLMQSPNTPISRETFETARDQFEYYKDKKVLLRERIRQETVLEQQQSAQIDSSIESVTRSIDSLARIIDSLNVRAPIDGQLSALDVELGQSFQRGQRIGQIDQLDRFKVRASIDQFYIARVAVGQTGRFELDGRKYGLVVSRIYPNVSDGVFEADMEFAAAAPEGIRRGQTLQIDLSLSEARLTTVVDKGGFFRHTNGRWAYLVSDDGRSARRTPIVIGRQNPQAAEVLKGLDVGDWIITSNYEGFRDSEQLSFPKPLELDSGKRSNQ